MLKVVNIIKKFGEVIVLKNLSFSVEKQSIFSIVGPDGAGKSTLLRILAGIIKPTSGEIYIDNLNVNTIDDIKYKISYMPQNFGLYEDLTVEENLHFIGKLFGIPEKERKIRIEKLYNFSKLKPFAGRLAGRLSGGMKQKLGLMCALLHNPELLILDEPTNGVDPISRREFWDVLYELLKAGTTIIVSTAYLDEAERANKIGLLYEGEFIFSDESSKIKNFNKETFFEITSDEPMALLKYLRKKIELDIFLRGNSLLFFADEKDKIVQILREENINWNIKEPSLEDIFIKCIKEKKIS
ncbi:MAG: ABC transporter ATP-binding protein [Brevinematales bacterium]|nr:ABC transporter ATP-binding protein [Brevinematales bacterium]